MQRLQISVVIPTCNRRERLLLLLQNLNQLLYPLEEVIIVDSGEERLSTDDYKSFSRLDIQYVTSEKSVCIQRNTGIKIARSPWIFLCDDDIEIPADYLDNLTNHIGINNKAGAVSGVWLQKEEGKWVSSYPVRSSRTLLWKFIFQQGIWGEIKCNANNWVMRRVKLFYQNRGNYITKAGWPVNTNFSGDYFVCPVYSLGASLIKREWLLHSPYDEVLDRYGIGDNYGVITGFPFPHVHVSNKAFVYHHREPTNRLKNTLQYYRRLLVIDYYIKIKKTPAQVKRRWLTWSLIGNLPGFILAEQGGMIKATWKVIWKILIANNPYYKANKQKRKVVEPFL